MKFACIASDSEQARRSQQQLAAKYDFVEAEDADVILALGGDGLMLHALHKYLDSGKPIYGLNCGTVGFLMNKFREERSKPFRVLFDPDHSLEERIFGEQFAQ